MSEAKHRDRRTVKEWMHAEQQAVLRAARTYAVHHGLRLPTIEDVIRADDLAMGHVDYAAKLAYAVAERMKAVKERGLQ
jgi:hypothetical protein